MYSKWGFWSIPPSDLRGRMRWWGLYTQRRPGIDGGRTAQLEPHQLDDEFFMLRVRSDGGQLSVRQARMIADVSRDVFFVGLLGDEIVGTCWYATPADTLDLATFGRVVTALPQRRKGVSEALCAAATGDFRRLEAELHFLKPKGLDRIDR